MSTDSTSTSPVALVAGASRGLGLLISRELIEHGYRVAICARDGAELDRAAELLGRAHVRTTVCDVTDRDGVRAWVADTERELGPIEVAITVAGVIQVGPGEDMTLEHFDEAIDIMLKGPIHVARTVEPLMRGRRRGRIGTVTSIGGMVSPPHLLPYATAKFGAVGFSDGLAASLSGSGVTATTIVPGLMRTGSHDQARFTGDAPRERAWFAVAASLPLLSMDAERAAARIVDGVLAGRPIVVLTPMAQVGIRVRGLAPGLTTRVMGLANRLLPRATGNTADVDGETARGRRTFPVVEQLTALGRRAKERFNEERPPRQ